MILKFHAIPHLHAFFLAKSSHAQIQRSNYQIIIYKNQKLIIIALSDNLIQLGQYMVHR